MATGYAGYQGYGDPDRVKAERARKLAETLQQGVQNSQPRNLVSGLAGLAEAFIAKDADTKAATAESAYGDVMKERNARLASSLMPDATGIANEQLDTAAPFDLTPNAMGQRRQQGGENARYRPIVEALLGEGNLGGAVGFVGDQQQMAAQRAEAARKAREPLTINNQLVDPQTYQPIADFRDAPKPVPKTYNEVTLADGVYSVNQNDPTDKILLGRAPAKAGEGPVDPNAPLDPERIRLEREYAKSWDAVRNNYSDVRGQYERLKSMGNLAATDPASRSAADLALIVSFTKMLDPGSVAREGEVKLTQSAASLYDTVRNLPNQWINGQTTIPDSTRRALLKAADEMMPSYNAAYERLAADIGSTADAYKFPRERVMMGYRPPAPPPPPPPSFMDTASQFVGNLFNGGQRQGGPQQPAPIDLSRLTPQQLDELEQQLSQGGGR